MKKLLNLDEIDTKTNNFYGINNCFGDFYKKIENI